MLAAVVSVMIYRMAVAVVFHNTDTAVIKRNAKFVASITAAMLNLCIIVMFNFVSQKLKLLICLWII